MIANLQMQQEIRRLMADGKPRRRMDIWTSLGWGHPRVVRATLELMADELEVHEMKDGTQWYRVKQNVAV